ncbi:MAG: hypothetical protein EOM11_10820, partial [Erysipelotrichia bacterium]|nr:hypothetical protein [Erysipelotrichia bacterium]
MKQLLFKTRNQLKYAKVLFILLISSASLYGQVPKLQINEIAQEADLIFIGTVEQQQCRKGVNNKIILTDVTFKEIEVIYSTPESLQKTSSKIVLTHVGGTYNDTSMSVSNMPHFKIGERYLLFTQDDGAIYANPIIGGHQGLFSIIVDKKTSEEYILTSSGKAILLLEIDEIKVTNDR